jgi:phage gpG-like protein
MRVIQEVKVNFNFHKVTGAAFDNNILASLEKMAMFAWSKVKKTFRHQKDITGKKYARSTSGYLNMKHNFKKSKIQSNKIMTDTGRLEKSIEHDIDRKNLQSFVGTDLVQYEQHLEDNISGIVRDKGVYKGYMGDFAPVPQRKWFFTSDEEAFEEMEKKIDKEVDAFFDEFVRNLSTSMRKLG